MAAKSCKMKHDGNLPVIKYIAKKWSVVPKGVQLYTKPKAPAPVSRARSPSTEIPAAAPRACSPSTEMVMQSYSKPKPAPASRARSPSTEMVMQSYSKPKPAPAPRAVSPSTEMVIVTDRRREVYVPSQMLQTQLTEEARPASPDPSPDADADPVAEALQLIQADMLAQASSGGDGSAAAASKEPVTIRLNPSAVTWDAPPSPPRRNWSLPRPAPDVSIFPDNIEDYCLKLRRGGRARNITDRFGELLQRQTVVQQLQRQLRIQTDTMRADARRDEAAADAERLRRFCSGEWTPGAPANRAEAPPSPVPPTTAAETLLVLREHGACGPSDMCVQPADLPSALSLIHRLRCEVLELRACSLRATCEKNQLAAQLASERAQLRRTFTSAQVARLTGSKARGRWGAEDVRRAIATRRVLSRRQYRYLTDVLHVPLPGLKLRGTATRLSGETKQLYEQLVAEKELEHRTKRRRVNAPARPAAAAKKPAPDSEWLPVAARKSAPKGPWLPKADRGAPPVELWASAPAHSTDMDSLISVLDNMESDSEEAVAQPETVRKVKQAKRKRTS